MFSSKVFDNSKVNENNLFNYIKEFVKYLFIL